MHLRQEPLIQIYHPVLHQVHEMVKGKRDPLFFIINGPEFIPVPVDFHHQIPVIDTGHPHRTRNTFFRAIIKRIDISIPENQIKRVQRKVYNSNMEEDNEDDDQYIETYASVTQFWSDLIESDMFTSIPEHWHQMACTKYTRYGIKLILEELDNVPDTQLAPDNAMPWALLYQRLHPEENTMELPWLTDESAYSDYPDSTSSCFREIASALKANLTELADNHETAYWGLTHKLERNLMTYLENKAEDWINHGLLPPYKE